MSEMPKPKVGTVAWTDLTIPNADEVRDFYAAVTGWKPEALSMGITTITSCPPRKARESRASAMRGEPTPTCRRNG